MTRLILCILAVFGPFLLHAQDDAIQLFNRAEHLRKSNSFIAAIDEYERAIALEPGNPRFHFSKGLCYLSLKEFDNAVLALEKTVQLKPDLINAYTMMATAYQAMERFVKVEESLDRAFKYETDPDRRIKYKQGIIEMLFAQEKYDGALRHVNEAKIVNPDVPPILYFEAAIQNHKGNYEAARAAADRAIGLLASKDPRVVAKFYYELGFAYNKLGKYEQSNEAFKYANVGPFRAKIARLSPAFYAGAAAAYMKLYDYDRARELLQTSLQMQNDFSQAFVMRATIAQMESDQSKAISELQKAANIERDSPKLARIYQQLTTLLLENKRYKDAAEASRKFQQLDQKNYEVIFMEAIAHYRQKHLKEAISVMERLVNFPGLDVESKAKYDFTLGLIYKDMKNYKLAKASFKHAQQGSFRTLAEMEEEEIIAIEDKTSSLQAKGS